MNKKAIYITFFCFGLMVLSFIAGAACVVIKRNPVGDFLMDAFMEGMKQQGNPHTTADDVDRYPRDDILHMTDSAMAQGKVSDASGKAFNGYTLITLRYSRNIWLVDMQGKVVHSWTPALGDLPHPPAANTENTVYAQKAWLYPNGDMLVLYHDGKALPYGMGLVKMDKHSRVLWKLNNPTHHDFYIDKKNGNIYVLQQQIRREQLEGLGALPYPLMEDSIIVLSPDGMELSRISILAAMRNSPYVDALFHEENDFFTGDITHTNSIMKLEPDMAAQFPMFHVGQVLISMRNLSALAVLDLQQGKIVWFEKGIWSKQHDASFQPDGTILLLDNLGKRSQGKTYSRILKIKPSDGQVVWNYSGSKEVPFYTYGAGRAQSLPNGDIVVTEALKPRVFELNTNGDRVWNYSIPALYAPILPNFAPYGNAGQHGRFPGIAAADPNLVTAITSAHRYAATEVSFLNTDLHLGQ